ncbi:hypothetical protein IAG44_39660 [Streptomyces roseirectus]|uniref:Uncharacterized protein n=1 Tax=Streptomyces roseirectus TaxID=2768066 RepID=A0A7H0IQ73_9ACTN|nr:hypothetical protein [Streptomyces roseirectus]QNP74939.1 hypothetical protein IAG44_39660 [Streptomyces roseirectus]
MLDGAVGWAGVVGGGGGAGVRLAGDAGPAAVGALDGERRIDGGAGVPGPW